MRKGDKVVLGKRRDEHETINTARVGRSVVKRGQAISAEPRLKQ
jgi:hypothetical protein